jgi:protein arginine kinase activator
VRALIEQTVKISKAARPYSRRAKNKEVNTMKCDKCEKEATFHFQSNINGEKTEYHLCEDCAKEAGYDKAPPWAEKQGYDSFLINPFSLMSGFFGAPSMSPFGALMGRTMLAPAQVLPWIGIFGGAREKSTDIEEKSADNIPEDAGEAVKAKREIITLRSMLEQAIKAEEFEKAAELRDKIHALEK